MFARLLPGLCAVCLFVMPLRVAAQTPAPTSTANVATPPSAQSSRIAGNTVDRSTGLPLPNVRVSIVGTTTNTVSDGSGAFSFALTPGVYVFEARVGGYQAVQTDSVTVTSGLTTNVTLALAKTETSSGNLREVARVTTRANDALRPAAVVQHTLSTGDELARGTFRIDRAIEELPNVVFSTGISTPGIDGYISLRGIPGGTQQLIDGHPTSVSLNSVALFPFQSVDVVYGSGKGQLYPINAIGGVIDLRTLQPTRTPTVSYLQSFGTFNKLTSDLQSTGTLGKFGYAFSFGTEGLDAPYARSTRYEPLSGWDPTATDPAVRNRSFYALDSPYAVRSEFGKFVYNFNNTLKMTGTVLGGAELHLNDADKSIDFHSFDRVLADGTRNLANKSAKDACPAGTFTATNFAGVPNGTGPDGKPDGGTPCQTPQQYATLRAGYTTGELGSITTTNADNDFKLENTTAHNYFLIDTYASVFQRSQDYHSTEFRNVPGDLNGLHTKKSNDSNAGFTISDDIIMPSDTVGFGYYTNNYRQNETGTGYNPVTQSTDGSYLFTYGNAIRAEFFKYIHHSVNSPLTFFLYDYIKDSQQPHAFFNDPRLAILYRKGNNTIRIAAGESSALPYAPDNQTYQPTPIAQFTNGVNCNGGNSVGSAPTGFTKPERASDEEISFAHRWHGDSTTQLELYSENFASKVQYGYQAPLTYTGTSFIAPALLQSYLNAITTKCGTPATPAQLTLQGNYNLGRVLARGIDLTGRQRVGSNVFFDYSYGTQSVGYRSLPGEVVSGDKRIIIGAQTFIPDSGQQIPLHSASLALDARDRSGLQGRMTGYYTGAGNQNGLPGFIRTDLSVNKSFSRFGSLTAYVYNLFNYAAYFDNQVGAGIPLPLNAFATAADYAPYFGAGTQNRFGIGARTLTLTLQVKI
ncbi:MAG: hypothetical protein NVS3B16_11800 [Vulcanimicrobiaceae bacterium]